MFLFQYSLAYACLKLVNYSLFFWLPTYLNRKFQWPQAEADNLSIWYDWGGIVGGFLGGILTVSPRCAWYQECINLLRINYSR